ncbi:FT-interacting protein 7-like [Oryza brachyantha]|nr:FT-interacting protein 7-like [Oryza brachyantha]
MPVPDRWFDLTRPAAAVQLEDSVDIANSRMRICLNVILDGRYHIVHDSRGYLDDTRPADRALWRAPIGRVHLGILRATGLPLRKNRSAMNPYCVAKYGDKWVRTRTVLDDGGAEHVFNEQHTWSVYDIATVLTVGVFDHCPDAPHREIGKVRIHLSSLERGRIYAHSYRLIILERDGVKRTGELQLAVKLSCGIALLRTYARPVLPRMHYTHPLSATENEELRSGAANVMALRFGRAEPPLRSEVVACMCSAAASGYHHWSLRKSKANFHRLVQLASPFVSLFHGVESVRSWRDPAATLLALAIFFVALWFHDLVPTMLFLCVVFKGVWNYRFRPTLPPYVDYRVSYLDVVHPDELDEEFDTFKSSREANLLRMRYDRLRMISGRVQTVVGDIASQGEKIRSLLSWRDPRATAIFQLFLLTAAVVVYLAPKKLLVGLAGLYIMRPPRYREKNTPSTIASFISRLPSNRDNLM